MPKKYLRTILFLCLANLAIQSQSLANDKVKNIVIFFGLNTSLPAYQNFLEGFQNKFLTEFKSPYNLSIEYLDLGRITDSGYAKGLIELYNRKFEKNTIDLLITVGPGALPLLKKYKLKALDISPTISVENEPLNPNTPISPIVSNRLDVILKYKIDSTLIYTFKLFPERKKVYVISGNSVIDAYYLGITKKAIQKISKQYQFIYINGISFDSTLKIVENLPSNSFVLVPIYFSDKDNSPYSTPEALGIISNKCNVPVVPLYDSFKRKRGALGGYVLSINEIGNQIAFAGIDILNGKKLSEFKDHTVDQSNNYQFIYDWQQLKKWNLENSDKLPLNAIYIDKKLSLFSEYKWEIIFFALLFLIQSALLFYLVKLHNRQKLLVKQKEETELLYREIIRDDRLSKMSELTASISHELNQPLTAILYSAQAGMRFLKSGNLTDEQAKEIFEHIIDDDKRAGALISSIRNLMKVESREWEYVNLKTLIEETINIFHADTVQNQIQIHFSQIETDSIVFGDRIQLQQVIMNLISNAAHSIVNSKTVNRIIDIKQVLNNESITISVRDHGTGIDPLILPKLFQPFVSFRKDGFGIGLVLSKSIIENHSGKIWAENCSDDGAIFLFTLKIKKQ